MFNKSGRLSTVIFVGVILLPLLGLLIMDYQLKRANDVTGAFSAAGASSNNGFFAGVAIVASLAIYAVLSFGVFRWGRSKEISTPPLEKINNEIDTIDKHLKRL